MAYRPVLTLEVEFGGAMFVFGPADRAWSKLAAAGARQGAIDIDGDNIPAELIEPMCELFVEGVIAWEGVEDADGEAMACTARTRQLIPSPDKIQIASAYLSKMQEIDASGEESAPPPTSSTGPEAVAAD